MTNEQAVADATNKIQDLKSQYMIALSPLVGGKVALTRELLLDCQQAGGRYFAFVEAFVGDSGLLGAHANGLWVTGFAETCQSVLESYVLHITLLRQHSSELGVAIADPSPCANANMQRMVREYLPGAAWKALEKKFASNKLPIEGFRMTAAPDKVPVPKWQLVTSVAIGCVCLVAVVILAVVEPNPTRFQEFVFRGLLATALASIVAIVPGFINLKVQARGPGSYFALVAGGALAIFVLIWMVNPPPLKEGAKENASEQVGS